MSLSAQSIEDLNDWVPSISHAGVQLTDGDVKEIIAKFKELTTECEQSTKRVQELDLQVFRMGDGLRIQLAGQAMQGLLAAETENYNTPMADCVETAIAYADALLAALRQPN